MHCTRSDVTRLLQPRKRRVAAATVDFVFKTKLNVFGILCPVDYNMFIVVNTFGGHLTDVSDRTNSLTAKSCYDSCVD